MRQLRLDNTTSTASKIVLVAGSLLILVGSGIYLFWDDAPPPPPPRVQTPSSAPVAAVGGEAEGAAMPVAEASEEQRQGAYLTYSAETLQRLTELQAALEVQRLQVALEEENFKIKKLLRDEAGLETLPQMPQVVAVPPGISAPVDIASSPAPLSPSAPPSPAVISVQGIGGTIAATVDTGAGLRTLKVGDDFGNGRVEDISVAGIHVREGVRTRLISVEE
jgi:hypothetical protein